MSDTFDVKELSDLDKNILNLASNEYPKQVKSFLQKEGNKLRKITVAKAKSKVKKKTGNYLRGIKRGKVYKYLGDEDTVRVYGGNHAHLIEKGHRIVTKDGREVGFAKGYDVFQEAEEEFENPYFSDMESFIDDFISKI